LSLKNRHFRSVPWPGNARDDRPGTHLSADSQGPIATHRPGNGYGSAVDRPILPVPEVGTTPTLAFLKADGSASTLADIRGKPTLVHFWASWCAPCERQLPAVARLQETAAEIDVVGLALDEDAVAWQEAIGTLALPWPQGRVENPADAGQSSVPAYWLLDASGKIVAKAHDADELPSLIEKHFK